MVHELAGFFACYFHEDWNMDANNPDEVIVRFLAGTPDIERVKQIAQEVRQYLASAHDDDVIERELYRKLYCNLDPSGFGMTARQWLSHVADRFEDAVRQREQHDAFLPASVSGQASRQGVKRKRADGA